MNVHEYQAKKLLSDFGVRVPGGQVAFNADEVAGVLENLSSERYVVKAQVHAGGRGKGGGIRVVDNAPDAEAAGLTRDGIEAAVEARLRERGVPLGRSQLAGDLYVRIATHRGATGLYAYFARVSLQQIVTIEGNQERAFVDTWDLDSLGTVGAGNLPQVQRVVLQIVDAFIDDYFSVNDPR